MRPPLLRNMNPAARALFVTSCADMSPCAYHSNILWIIGADASSGTMRDTIAHTLAEALLQACMDSAPRHAAVDDLLVDVQEDEQMGVWRIWVHRVHARRRWRGPGVRRPFLGRTANL